jgi:hypothetical protein
MRGGKIKRMVEGVNSSMIYLIHCKNFCKCHNVPQPSTTIKEKMALIKRKDVYSVHRSRSPKVWCWLLLCSGKVGIM